MGFLAEGGVKLRVMLWPSMLVDACCAKPVADNAAAKRIE
jgi:hypothetical protein